MGFHAEGVRHQVLPILLRSRFHRNIHKIFYRPFAFMKPHTQKRTASDHPLALGKEHCDHVPERNWRLLTARSPQRDNTNEALRHVFHSLFPAFVTVNLSVFRNTMSRLPLLRCKETGQCDDLGLGDPTTLVTALEFIYLSLTISDILPGLTQRNSWQAQKLVQKA